MKYILLILLFVPSIVGCADYTRISNCARVVDQVNGKTVKVTERTKQFKRLYYFISSHPAEKSPVEMTELIYSCPYPEQMAAIASTESGFDPYAVGADGEVSMWQILEWELGDPTNKSDALKAAIKVFEQKKVGRSVNQAIKRYNGSGEEADIYQSKVLKKIQMIKNIKV